MKKNKINFQIYILKGEQNKMKKEIKKYFGKKNYLLGKNEEGQKIWLVAPSWDCDWYWGFGYLETYSRRNGFLDIDCHTHFNSTFFEVTANCFDMFKNYFKETPLTDNEIWTLCDYMKSFYILRESAEFFRHGYSYITGRAKIDELQRTDLEDEINKNMLPQLFDKIDKLLTPQE